MALAYTSLWTNEDIKLESGFEFRCPKRNGSDKLANNHACAQTRDKGDRWSQDAARKRRCAFTNAGRG
jgi:hypothetical protein